VTSDFLMTGKYQSDPRSYTENQGRGRGDIGARDISPIRVARDR